MNYVPAADFRKGERSFPRYDDYQAEYPQAEYEPIPAGGGVEIRAIWSAVYRNWLLIAATVALALAGGLATILLTSPTYRARSTIQVDQQLVKLIGTEDAEPAPSAQEADRFLQTQVDILKSRTTASAVADRLRLDRDAQFLKENSLDGAALASRDVVAKEELIEAVQERLGVSLPRNSRVISINFESRSAPLAAKVANSFADTFIADNLQRRFETSSYSRAFLQKQLAATKLRLEDSERALIEYARGAQLIDTSAATTTGDDKSPRSLTTSNLVQINAAYSLARSTRIQAQQRWQQAQATPLLSLPEVLSNQAIQELTERRAELQASYQQERQRRKADHPSVQQAAANLRELSRQIATLAGSIRTSLRDNYLVAQRQEQALQNNVVQLKGETLAEQDRGVRYNILKREVDTNRELYDGLLQRYKEISAQAGATNNNISIIDRAHPPVEPVAPKPMLNMALAGSGGLLLALMLVFAREKLDDAVRGPDDVERKLGVPLLGTVPMLKAADLHAELGDPKSGISEAHHALRTSLELSSGRGMPFSLLLTSSGQGEGKSTTAFALAREFAASGRRVLLIDADLRKPSLHRLTTLPNMAGLANLLARQKVLADVVLPGEENGFDFIPSGPLPPNPAELFAGSTLGELLVSLRDRYDLLIIDGPPVLGLADAPRLGAIADAAVFIVEANSTNCAHARSALKRLGAGRTNLLGAILTKFEARKIGYGDDYAYGYGFDYGTREKA